MKPRITRRAFIGTTALSVAALASQDVKEVVEPKDSKEKKSSSEKKNPSTVIHLLNRSRDNINVQKIFQIESTPAFVLIDKDRKIITTEAPYPSSNQIRPLLDSLLNR